MAGPLQTNAADPRQLRHAERVERKRLARQRDALTAVMNTPEGRELIWSMLAPIYRSSWARDASIHFNEGIRNVALELRARLEETDELHELYLTMEREMRTLARRESNEAEAVRTNGAQNDGN